MRIALIGDSHSQAVFPLLAKKLKAKGDDIVLQISKPGWDILSFQKEGKLESDIFNSRPDMAIFSLGGNNFELSQSYKSKLDWLISIARKSNPNIKIVYVGPAKSIKQDVDKRHSFTNEFIKKFSRENGIVYIDVYNITGSGHRSDGVHFTNDKYKEWSDYVFSNLNNEIEKQNIPAVKKAKLVKKKNKNNTLTIGLLSLLAVSAVVIIGIRMRRNRNLSTK